VHFLRLSYLWASAFAHSFDIVVVGAAALAACGRLSGGQLEPAQLCRMKSWPTPQVVLLFGQQVPDQNRELSGGCDRRDMLAAARADAQKECPQRTGRPRRGPGRFHAPSPGLA